MNTTALLMKFPWSFYAVIRNHLGKAAGLFPHEWGNEIVPNQRVCRIYDFDGDSAQAIHDVFRAAFGSNLIQPPVPEFDETVAEYVIKAAHWVQSQNIDLDEATEILRAMLSGS